MRLTKLLWAIVLVTSTLPLAVFWSGAVAASANGKLVNTEWRLKSFGGSGSESTASGKAITLKFGSDGRASGSGGCNAYSGAYREQAERLSFSRIISTKRACLEQTANQHEQRYLAALESATRFKLSGDRLTIYYDAGRGVLNFVNDSSAKTEQEKYENLSSPVDLLASFYNAVNNKDYARAHGYWETPPGTLDEFQKGYRDTSNVQLIVQPPTHLDGAAGSLYAEIPTVIVAGQRNGAERVFAGCYVMRKANLGQTGATKENAWRIYKASMSPVAGNAAIRPKLFAQACAK